MVLWSCSNKSWSIDHCDRSQVLIEYDEVAYLQPTINNFLLQRNGISCSMVPLIFYLSKVPIIENFYLLWLFDLLLTVNFCWFISLTVFSAASAESFCRKIQITATCFLTHATPSIFICWKKCQSCFELRPQISKSLSGSNIIEKNNWEKKVLYFIRWDSDIEKDYWKTRRCELNMISPYVISIRKNGWKTHYPILSHNKIIKCIEPNSCSNDSGIHSEMAHVAL